MTEASPAIRFEAVSLRRGERCVLDDLSFDVRERRVGLIGDNAAGKSSLVRLLNGLLLPSAGRVEVFGRDTARHQRNLPGLVGFIFQNPDHQILLPTVEEEVAFGALQQGHDRVTARARARDLLARHGLHAMAATPVQHLSEGQKQLVCLLAVLIMKPRLLVLDEPFSSLDLKTRGTLSALIDSLDEHVLMITHDLSAVSRFERVLWLHEGRIRADGRPDAVLPAYQAYTLNADTIGGDAAPYGAPVVPLRRRA